MSELIWEDPVPAKRGPKVQTDAIAEQLREHPNKWARIYSNSTNASNIRRRLGPEFEVTTTRGDVDLPAHKRHIFARFVGGQPEQQTTSEGSE